tara:strand:- start:2314 stop:3276 length:963 start_codon:yes stop_codon:yes gene_type:complete
MVSPNLVQFGNTELKVSRFCQGTAFRNMPRESDNTIGQRVLEHCIDEGINFFDSANGYGFGGSERLLGKAISGKRSKVVVCTKVGANHDPDKDGKRGAPASFSIGFLSERASASLERLATDYLDLYLLHKEDGITDPEDIVESMEYLVKEGKIRYWGVSNHSAEVLTKYIDLYESGDAPHFAGVEEYYNIGGESVLPNGKSRIRMLERKIFPLIIKSGLGMLAFSPHDMGNLIPGKSAKEGTPLAMLLKALDKVAIALSVPRSQVCVAWALSHPEVTCTLGAAESPEHVEDNIYGSSLKIPQNLLEFLNTASVKYSNEQE